MSCFLGNYSKITASQPFRALTYKYENIRIRPHYAFVTHLMDELFPKEINQISQSSRALTIKYGNIRICPHYTFVTQLMDELFPRKLFKAHSPLEL